jgi:hypothetical protein
VLWSSFRGSSWHVGRRSVAEAAAAVDDDALCPFTGVRSPHAGHVGIVRRTAPGACDGVIEPDAPSGDLGGSGSMSAGSVTDWEWPRVQAAVLRRSLPRVRKVVQVMPMATFRTYAEVLRPDHPMMRNYKASLTWRPSRYRPAELDRDMRAEPGVVLGDVLRRTGGVYETTTRLTPEFREHIREIAELTSDEELLRVSELPEVPVSLEHLRHVDRQTRILVGYRLDVTPAESPGLRRRHGLPPDPRIMLHFDEVPFPDAPGRLWGACRWEPRASRTPDRA